MFAMVELKRLMIGCCVFCYEKKVKTPLSISTFFYVFIRIFT